MVAGKQCDQCGDRFPRRLGDSAAQWESRRFCSRRCYWSAMRGPHEAKVCEQCGATFQRRGGTNAMWERRRFCSQPCSAMFHTTPYRERVLGRIERGNACWGWTGTIRHGERGAVHGEGGRLLYAYRAVYELLVGPIPEGYLLHHICENPACVNPDHLEPTTAGKHMAVHRGGVPRSPEVCQKISEGHRRRREARVP